MESNERQKIIFAPKVTKAIGEGFRIAAENLYLLILPLLADLLIWLGPKFRVYELLREQVSRLFSDLTANAPQELAAQVSSLYQSAQVLIEQTNLMSALGAFPFSVPMLLNGITPLKGPLGNLKIIEIHSPALVLILFLLLGCIGLFSGIFYLTIIAQASDQEARHVSLRRLGKNAVNLVLFLLALLGIFLALMIPVSCFFTFLSILSVSLAQIILLILFLGVAWLIIPMFYIPHGIVLSDLNLTDAVKLSFRISRWVSSSTSFFVVFSVIILQGLNLIWTIPPADSWLLLIGIAGHAFIITALISASFILYQQNLQWLSDNAEIIKRGIIQK